MSQNSNEKSAQRSQRRAFFGQLLAAVGGGVLGGSILQKLFGSRKQAREKERPVNISINPLAVPRSKEGSKSNV
ncbi:MAG: hypothetical protein ABSE41_06995 [Bacteroidota bacterium]|jgi:hypothetical protein